MNADRLLAHYEQIADAPDAIARLRRFVLDLAVRGKLVPQDAKDESASELLKRIAKEKARLVKAGEIRDKPSLPAVAKAHMPFLIPSKWEWVRLANIVDFSAGRTPSRNDTSFWNNGDHAWVSIADMEDGQVLTTTKETVSDQARERVFRSEPEAPGTILMSFKLTIGKIARLGVPAFHNEAIISIRPHLAELDAYLFKILPQFARQGDTKGAIKGATLNRDSISNILLPLPPLAEQHRIVAKVDELMGLCDRLEAARAGREATRDRLAAASLARLNAPDPETFQDDARFALATLPALTTRPDQIKRLRQTILNLAVRGKLVPQDANDEPAAELLKRIAKEKARRLKSGRSGSLPRVATATSLPENWTDATLSELAIFENGDRSLNYPSGTDILGSGVAFFSTKNLSDHQLHFTNLDYISEAKFASLRSGKLQDRDILVTLRGSVGKFGLFRASDDIKTGFINAQLLIVRSFLPEFVDFLLAFMKSEAFSTQLDTRASGSATPQLSAGQLAQVVIPLPPLAEQHRIVAKVDELMGLCDRLETSLDQTATTRRRLLDALLAEAVAPVDARDTFVDASPDAKPVSTFAGDASEAAE